MSRGSGACALVRSPCGERAVTRRTALAVAFGVLGLLLVVVVVVGIAQSGKDAKPVSAPDVRGLRLDVADTRLESLNLDVRTAGGGSFGVVRRSKWWVCTQDPRPGQRTTEVEVFVDRECTWAVPGVTGLALARAQRALDKADVPYDEIGVAGRQPLAGWRWFVCEQRPTSGIATSRVRLTVARACELPDVMGMTRAKAVHLLERLGIAVTAVTADGERPAAAGRWSVCDQSPGPFEAANAVTLTVAPYCRAAAPDVEWLRLDVAAERLDASGLQYDVVTPAGTPPLPRWTVCDQDPEAGVETESVMLFLAQRPSRCAKTWPGSQ